MRVYLYYPQPQRISPFFYIFAPTTNKITMPRLIKKKLQTTAKKKFPGDKERQNAYVYGTLAKIEKSKK